MSDLTGQQIAQAIEDASPQFGLAPTHAQLLSRSENIVCALTLSGGGRVVMRFHRPGYNTFAELESEAQWVHALAAAGMSVPNPVATIAGPRYTSVRVGGQSRFVGVVAWIPGEPLDEITSSSEIGRTEDYGRVGALAAQIRLHSNTWHRPDGFVRRSWDVDGLLGDDPLWGRFWEVSSLSDEERTTFLRCRDALRSQLHSLPTTNDRFGLIHADLHPGNLIASGGDLTVIDFDDGGFGWYEHELAVALRSIQGEPWEPDARAALLDEYRKVHPMSEGSDALIDAFLTIRDLILVGWLDARPELADADQVAAVADQAKMAANRYLESQ